MPHSVLLLKQKEIFWALILAKSEGMGSRPPPVSTPMQKKKYRIGIYFPYKSRKIKIKMGINEYYKRKPVTIFGLPSARIAQVGFKL